MKKQETTMDDWGERLAATTEAHRKRVWNEALNLAELSLEEKCDCPERRKPIEKRDRDEHSIGCTAGWPAKIVRGLRL
jgi:hypothetical protein